MREINFRTLRADEIDVRTVTIKDNKATMLLYIDSRAVVRLLNETVGASDWEMVFETVNGQVVGKMGIWDEDKGMFVYKSDTGSESNIEATKGLFSDCYKRCLSRWGVDELYTAPRIVIPDDGYGCSGYKVSHIEYNDRREIIRLRIVNRFDKVVFDYAEDNLVMPQNKPVQTQQAPQTTNTTSMDNVSILRGFCSKKKKEETDKDDLLRFFNFYKERVNGWTNVIKPEILWNKWQETRRKT